MVVYRFYELLRGMSGHQWLWWFVWCGLALLTIALLVMMRTNWGQSRPLHKCAALSLLAHLLFACFAATVQIVQSANTPLEPSVRISSIDGIRESEEIEQQRMNSQPWETLPAQVPTPVADVNLDRTQHDELPTLDRAPQDHDGLLPGELPLTDLPALPAELPTPDQIVAGDQLPLSDALQPAAAIETPAAKRRADSQTQLPVPDGLERAETIDELSAPAALAAPTSVPSELLEQPPTMPRMSDAPVTTTPQESLADLIDDASSASSPRPADAVAHDDTSQNAANTDTAGDTASSDAAEPLALDRPEDEQTRPIEGLVSQGNDHRIGNDSENAVPQLVPVRRGRPHAQVPEVYRQRLEPERSRQAMQQGATPESEAAVTAALRWLTLAQGADGRWDPVAHGGGFEPRVLGHDRQSAGIDADTGITGLALLAYLGAGHTHQSGDFPEQVNRGLDYLIRTQAPNGSLAGPARTYAAMYCHGMATLALSEAFAMTGDPRLETPLRRATQFTLGAQNITDGGWRYKPLDRGDTSQLGWQLMALRSAELAGFPLPEIARERMLRFLRNVSVGNHGGLACYRPNEQVSRTMTAEALVCRQFLGLSREHPAVREASAYLLEELPQQAGRANLYYWYYATLALHQAQGPAWQRWNEALQPTLLGSQRSDGPLAGSWDADTVWGGYGGRVYSTAMATLCLEVYYRYLPLYVDNVAREPNAPRNILPK